MSATQASREALRSGIHVDANPKAFVEFLWRNKGRISVATLLALIIAACDTQIASAPGPDQTNNQPPTTAPTQTVEQQPTIRATAVVEPTKTAEVTPTPGLRLFIPAGMQGSAVAEMWKEATPTAEPATATPEPTGTAGMNAQFEAAIQQDNQKMIEMLKGEIDKNHPGSEFYYAVPGFSVHENGDGSYDVIREMNVVSKTGELVCSATQKFTMSLDLDKGAITKFTPGEIQVSGQLSETQMAAVQKAVETKLGRPLNPEEKIKVAAQAGDNNVRVAGVVNTSGDVPVFLPVAGSEHADAFTQSSAQNMFDATSLVEVSEVLDKKDETLSQAPGQELHVTQDDIKELYGRSHFSWVLKDGKSINDSPITFSLSSGRVVISKENGQEVKVKPAVLTARVETVNKYEHNSSKGFWMTLVVEYDGRQIIIPTSGIPFNGPVYFLNPNSGYKDAYPVSGTDWEEIINSGGIKEGDLIGILINVPVEGESTFPFYKSFIDTLDAFLSGKDIDPNMLYPNEGRMMLMPSGFYVPELVEKYPSPY